MTALQDRFEYTQVLETLSADREAGDFVFYRHVTTTLTRLGANGWRVVSVTTDTEGMREFLLERRVASDDSGVVMTDD